MLGKCPECGTPVARTLCEYESSVYRSLKRLQSGLRRLRAIVIVAALSLATCVISEVLLTGRLSTGRVPWPQFFGGLSAILCGTLWCHYWAEVQGRLWGVEPPRRGEIRGQILSYLVLALAFGSLFVIPLGGMLGVFWLVVAAYLALICLHRRSVLARARELERLLSLPHEEMQLARRTRVFEVAGYVYIVTFVTAGILDTTDFANLLGLAAVLWYLPVPFVFWPRTLTVLLRLVRRRLETFDSGDAAESGSAVVSGH